MEPLITDWIIAFGTFGTIIMVGVLVWTVTNQKKQLLVSNYDVITNYIGSEKCRYARRILVKHYESKINKSFFEKFSHGKVSEEFDDYNEWGKYIGAIYSRVSFLLQQDKTLQEKFIQHHGYTMGIMWIMYKPFMEMWERLDEIKQYTEFKEIGELCYCKWKEKITKFLNKKKEQNQNRTKFEWFIEKRKSPLEF